MKRGARTIVYLLGSALALAGGVAAGAQSSSPELTIGTVRTVSASAQEQQFTLDLVEGQGVVVDLLPLPLVDEAGQPIDPTADFVEPVDDPPIPDATDPYLTAAMRMLDPKNACIRSMPERPECLSAGAASTIEYQAGQDVTRMAVRPLAAGTYSLVLLAPPRGDISRYELLVRARDLPRPIVADRIELCHEPALPRPQSGEAPPDDPCAVEHMMGRTGRAYFEFATTEPDSWVQIDMASQVLDSLVQLSGPLGNAAIEDAPTIASNDDSNGTLNSQIRMKLAQPGRYVVIGSGLFQGPGPFTLAVRQLPPPPKRPALMLQLGTPVTDSFSEQELLPYHEYTVEPDAGTTVVIEMKSDILDSRLEAGIATLVFDEEGVPADNFASLASSDDSCGTRDARLRLRFGEKRLVTIQASPLGGNGGEYTIVARPAEGPTCPQASELSASSD